MSEKMYFNENIFDDMLYPPFMSKTYRALIIVSIFALSVLPITNNSAQAGQENPSENYLYFTIENTPTVAIPGNSINYTITI